MCYEGCWTESNKKFVTNRALALDIPTSSLAPDYIIWKSFTKMKTTTILAVVAIVAALGAVTPFIPIYQVSAASKANPNPNDNITCLFPFP
jgi:hypothetical protein